MQQHFMANNAYLCVHFSFIRMNYLIPISLFLLTAFAPLAAQVPDPEAFDLEDQATILATLFDTDRFSAEAEALWKPTNYAERNAAFVSDDGYYHTSIDTVLYYTTFGLSKAVVVFFTYNYDKGQVNACNTCGVQVSIAHLLAQGEKKWTVESFFKHFTTIGSFGEGGIAGLVQFGPDEWCVSLEHNWLSQGVYSDFLEYYSVEEMRKVFNFIKHEDNSGALGVSAERSYSCDQSIHFLTGVETESGWWDFELVSRGTIQDPRVERSVPANAVERFSYDWMTESYMRSCK